MFRLNASRTMTATCLKGSLLVSTRRIRMIVRVMLNVLKKVKRYAGTPNKI